MMNAGAGSRALIRVTACVNVPSASVLASPLKPMCVSLICTKLKSGRGSTAAAGRRVRDRRTPPVAVQTSPVPAHAMHCRNPRRSTPSPRDTAASTFSSAFLTRSLMMHSSPEGRGSLHDDGAGHQGMQGAEVLIHAGLRERVRIPLAGFQARRFEDLVGGDHGVHVFVAVQPAHGRTRGHRERRADALVLCNLDLRSCLRRGHERPLRLARRRSRMGWHRVGADGNGEDADYQRPHGRRATKPPYESRCIDSSHVRAPFLSPSCFRSSERFAYGAVPRFSAERLGNECVRGALTGKAWLAILSGRGSPTPPSKTGRRLDRADESSAPTRWMSRRRAAYQVRTEGPWTAVTESTSLFVTRRLSSDIDASHAHLLWCRARSVLRRGQRPEPAAPIHSSLKSA